MARSLFVTLHLDFDRRFPDLAGGLRLIPGVYRFDRSVGVTTGIGLAREQIVWIGDHRGAVGLRGAADVGRCRRLPSGLDGRAPVRSEEHEYALKSLMRSSYDVC